MGTLHGGVLCDVADAAMGVAYASTLKMENAARQSTTPAKPSDAARVATLESFRGT